MRVAVIGATGNIGTRLVGELLARGHDVTAIARHASNLSPRPGLTVRDADLSDTEGLAAILKGHDAVISAVRFSDGDPEKLIGAVKAAGVKRYLVVGGAASLEVAPGRRLFDAPQFPDAYRKEAGAGIAFLDRLKREAGLDWTFLSPSAVIGPGQRTGKFRLGTDSLLTDAKGGSHISYEDYAVAMIDELEKSAHVRRRFTVGY